LWSDVFIYDAPDGEKYAILLVDTQGLFDHDTPPAINSKIFSFTTLITSIQIFNLANLIQEDQLEYLQVQWLLLIQVMVITYNIFYSSPPIFQDIHLETTEPENHSKIYFF
jgi:hypothetical protein